MEIDPALTALGSVKALMVMDHQSSSLHYGLLCLSSSTAQTNL
jgi:hypothetical protein